MEKFDIGKGFPSIEVDVDYFKSLTHIERIKYILKLFFNESGLGNRLKMMDYIVTTLSIVSDAFIKNGKSKGDIEEYIKLIQGASSMVGVATTISNVFKAKQNPRNKKNDAIAKLMGFPTGQYVDGVRIEANSAMTDAFIGMSDNQMSKFNIKIENVVDGSKKSGANTEDDEVKLSSEITLIGTLNGEIKWGMTIKGSTGGDESTTTNSVCHLYYPVHKVKGMSSDELRDEISSIMLQVFADKVNKYKNYLKVKGRNFEICERKTINANIRNIDINELVLSMNNVLEDGNRRGVILAGEPGVGKTIAVHKIVNQFRDRLVFWVSPDSLQTVASIRDIFKVFRLFKNSIIVLDDIDAADLTNKDQLTNVFLQELDGTSDLTGFIIGVVNDPSLIHPALICRPERFDEAIEVKKPSTEIEIVEILEVSATNSRYKSMSELDDYYDVGEYIDSEQAKLNKLITMTDEDLDDDDRDLIEDFQGYESEEEIRQAILDDWLDEEDRYLYDVDTKSDAFNVFVKKVLSIPPEDSTPEQVDEYVKHQCTQVMISGLISHCISYRKNNRITLSDLENAYDKRMKSIKVTNLVAKKGRLTEDSNGISDEARANLSRHK